MKRIILVSLVMASHAAFASKARISTLQEADYVVDIQTIFNNPADINQLAPFITYEMGTPQGAPSAEGGFSQKLASGALLGIYLGHDNSSDLRDGTTYLKQRNPIELTYGMGNQGYGLSLSTTDDKKNGKKETTVVGKWGMRQEHTAIFVNAALVSTAEQTTPEQKMSAPQIVVGGSYEQDTNHFFGQISYSPAKEDITGTSTDIKDAGIELGWLSHNLKKPETDIYYGAKIEFGQRDAGGKKITASRLPVFLGMEHTITSWATFRGSVKQNFIVGSTKDETATNTDAESTAADTTFAGGLGFKYNGLVLDGSLASSTNGAINGNAFLTQASVTYNY